MSQIKSRNPLFLGQLVDKPKQATVVCDANGDAIYKCPNCGNCASDDHCDAIGAEPNCLFCNQCNQEFHC